MTAPARARATTPLLSIAVDAMSGDGTVHARIEGVLLALADDPALRVMLVGLPEILAPEIERLAPAAALRDRLELVAAAQVVSMDESPRQAIRRKKDSSLRRVIDLVHENRAAACVSAGNTGALTATAHFVLKTLPGVERAPIMSAVPSDHGHTHLLDLGANTQATPLQLLQFAQMGSIVARDVYGLAEPRVGLLNIGAEDMKGHEIVQAAHELLRSSGLAYVGFVEGHDIFSGKVDVVVTDGFTGNVALKTMEGVAGLIASRLRAEFLRDWPSRIAGLIARPVLARVSASLDPRRHNGACMVGLTGIVVKSHGNADATAFARAIAIAAAAARNGLTEHIARSLGAEPRTTKG
jgi:glycerol-3-phosphate acyltransferase PlsX